MTTAQAQKLIVVFGVTTGASVYFGNVLPKSVGGKGEKPPIRSAVGTLATFTVLSLLSEFTPGLAATVSGVVAGTAFMEYLSEPATKYLDQIN